MSERRVTPPSLIVFDVNETLSDMSPLAERFGEVGAPGHLAKTCSPNCCVMASHWPRQLVAVHPWDIDGANRAGLATAWLNRTDSPYPDYFRRANLQATSLIHLAQLLS